jgi:ficolin
LLNQYANFVSLALAGVYTLKLGNEIKKAYCDMDTKGGGWTVIQRRGDFGNPQTYFLRNWTDYKAGFGEPEEDVWLGLDSIHELGVGVEQQLLIVLEDFDNNQTSLIVTNFTVGDETSGYALSYKYYNSKIGNSLPARGTKFSTVDMDNDAWKNNCAKRFSGAWWYSACHNSNLNGLYLKGEHESFGNGVNWYHWKGYHYSLKLSVMMIRAKDLRTKQESEFESESDRKRSKNKVEK